jgi:hypothetical protein
VSERVQHVNFWWLKEPGNAAHIQALTDAIAGLRSIPGVTAVSFGPRTPTDWEGPDATFDYGMIVSFESVEAVRAYLPHPAHLAAIEVSSAVGERFHAFYFDG